MIEMSRTLKITMVHSRGDKVAIMSQTLDGEPGDVILNGQNVIEIAPGDVVAFKLCENGKLRLFEHEPSATRHAVIWKHAADAVEGKVVDITSRQYPAGYLFTVNSEDAVIGDNWTGDRLVDAEGNSRDARFVLVREKDGEVVRVGKSPMKKAGHFCRESNSACANMHVWDADREVFMVKKGYRFEGAPEHLNETR